MANINLFRKSETIKRGIQNGFEMSTEGNLKLTLDILSKKCMSLTRILLLQDK